MTRNYHAETAASITALAQRIMGTNLCREILLTADYESCTLTEMTFDISFKPKSKYNFSRNKWYTASYGDHDVIDVYAWCEQQFGQGPENPDAWCRWYSVRPWVSINFRDQKDYNWFILRWGA